MSFNQTREILDRAGAFHQRLIRLYEELLQRAAEEETRDLIQDLIAHERLCIVRLEDYKETGSKNMLDTFFKYMVDGTETQFFSYGIPDVVDNACVIAAARYFDECLSRFYKEMSRKALSAKVREMLENLQAMEQREQLVLSKIALGLKPA